MRQQRKRQTLVSIIIVILFVFAHAHSQNVKAQTLDAGGFAGGSYYLGDINPDQHFVGSRLAYGLLVRLNFSDRISLRTGIIRGTLQADDMNFRDKGKLPVPNFSPSNPVIDRDLYVSRGLNFTTNVTEIALQAEINFLDFFVGSQRHRWTPFIFGGASMFMFKSKRIGTDFKLQDFGTEGQLHQHNNGKTKYSNTAFAIPFGIGVKFSLGKRLGMSVEWGMRKTFTDYIDDISTTYVYDIYGFNKESNVYYGPNPYNPEEIVALPITDDVLLSDPTLSHRKGQQRGNDYNTDWYSFYGITLTYSFDLQGNRDCRNFDKKH